MSTRQNDEMNSAVENKKLKDHRQVNTTHESEIQSNDYI